MTAAGIQRWLCHTDSNRAKLLFFGPQASGEGSNWDPPKLVSISSSCGKLLHEDVLWRKSWQLCTEKTSRESKHNLCLRYRGNEPKDTIFRFYKKFALICPWWIKHCIVCSGKLGEQGSGRKVIVIFGWLMIRLGLLRDSLSIERVAACLAVPGSALLDSSILPFGGWPTFPRSREWVLSILPLPVEIFAFTTYSNYYFRLRNGKLLPRKDILHIFVFKN